MPSVGGDQSIVPPLPLSPNHLHLLPPIHTNQQSITSPNHPNHGSATQTLVPPPPLPPSPPPATCTATVPATDGRNTDVDGSGGEFSLERSHQLIALQPISGSGGEEKRVTAPAPKKERCTPPPIAAAATPATLVPVATSASGAAQKLLGRRVVKNFEGNPFRGQVTAFDPKAGFFWVGVWSYIVHPEPTSLRCMNC
jgi:hypothetical protein